MVMVEEGNFDDLIYIQTQRAKAAMKKITRSQ